MAGHGVGVGLDLVQSNDNSVPPSTHIRVKAKPDGEIYTVNSAGEERQVGHKEVFIGAPAIAPTYPSIVFEAVTIDGQTVYRMRVSDGTA